VANPNKKLGMLSPLRGQVWDRDRGLCCECGRQCKRQKVDKYDNDPALGEIDHILARADGGLTVLENLQLLCLSCNRKNGGRELVARNQRRVA